MSILVKNNIHWVGQRDWKYVIFTALNTKRCVQQL
ncbi:flavoprotein [Salmonella enterica subsp. enterica]|uniref:Flavoprotein n=1 Tax=Salmonella enterica I TaxID=59201 RepID=A0A379UTZ2_SALET|nr:flavoprotein [Salmonella enterica subsp. enterica]